MKITSTLFLFVLSILSISCDDDKTVYERVNVAEPIYMDRVAFRSSVEISASTEIINSGKIYAYNNLVLVNDVDIGIHIIDNSNPESPSQIAFIKIIGNIDMEIKGNYLYADSLMDLVVFDLSDINNIKQVKRLEDVFYSYVPFPTEDNLVYNYTEQVDYSTTIQVGWKITEERMTIDEVNRLTGDIWGGGILEDTMLFNAASAAEATGQGGSLARFKIVGDFLYAVDNHSFNIFNIHNLDSPIELQDVHAGFDIETIFYSNNLLFLGSNRGMYIYDIIMPSTPQLVSELQHGTACDPVVVDDEHAYITLRGGNFCGALESQLLIVDITDVYNPTLKEEYAMDEPFGLGIKDDLLFICDGTSGLKVYNKADVENLALLNTFENVTAYDVIPMTNHLLMIGENTLFQYHYSDDGLDMLSEFSLN